MNLRESIIKTNNQATNIIAYVVLAVFSTFLLILLIKATLLASNQNVDQENFDRAKVWLDIFKDGFLLLGGALTTLIGYYFGNKGSENALSNAEKLTQEAENMLNQLSEAAPTQSENETDIETF